MISDSRVVRGNAYAGGVMENYSIARYDVVLHSSGRIAGLRATA